MAGISRARQLTIHSQGHTFSNSGGHNFNNICSQIHTRTEIHTRFPRFGIFQPFTTLFILILFLVFSIPSTASSSILSFFPFSAQSAAKPEKLTGVYFPSACLYKWTSRRTKITRLTNLIIQDLGIDPCRMRPAPIYIDWENGCLFTWSIPPQRLDLYQNHIENLLSDKLKPQR